MTKKKLLLEINKKLDNINNNILNKAIKYTELKNNIDDIVINVKRAWVSFDDVKLNYVVNVEYEVPPIKLLVENNGNIETNQRFTAMNLSGMISLDDMQTLYNVIEKATNKAKGGD